MNIVELTENEIGTVSGGGVLSSMYNGCKYAAKITLQVTGSAAISSFNAVYSEMEAIAAPETPIIDMQYIGPIVDKLYQSGMYAVAVFKHEDFRKNVRNWSLLGGGIVLMVGVFVG